MESWSTCDPDCGILFARSFGSLDLFSFLFDFELNSGFGLHVAVVPEPNSWQTTLRSADTKSEQWTH